MNRERWYNFLEPPRPTLGCDARSTPVHDWGHIRPRVAVSRQIRIGCFPPKRQPLLPRTGYTVCMICSTLPQRPVTRTEQQTESVRVVGFLFLGFLVSFYPFVPIFFVSFGYYSKIHSEQVWIIIQAQSNQDSQIFLHDRTPKNGCGVSKSRRGYESSHVRRYSTRVRGAAGLTMTALEVPAA